MLLAYLLAAASTIGYAASNTIDNKLIHQNFSNAAMWTYSAVLQLIIGLMVWACIGFVLPPLNTWYWWLIVGTIEVLYIAPYYAALKHASASTVTGLFSLQRVFTPILAYIFIKEHLVLNQYLGCAIIFISSLWLAQSSNKVNLFSLLKPSKALNYMIFCNLLLSVQLIIIKHMLDNHTGIVPTMSWAAIGSIPIVTIMICLPKLRGSAIQEIKLLKSQGYLVILQEVFCWIANILYIGAMNFLPASVVKAISSGQGLFVFIFGWWSPAGISERTNYPQKLMALSLLILGVVLTCIHLS